jgi:hypothetical protein
VNAKAPARKLVDDISSQAAQLANSCDRLTGLVETTYQLASAAEAVIRANGQRQGMGGLRAALARWYELADE